MGSFYKVLFGMLLISLLTEVKAQNTFSSVQTGNWDDASTWRAGAGAGGTEGIDYPSPTDNVYLNSGDTVYLNVETSTDLYSFEGFMEIDTVSLLWVVIGDNDGGLSLEGDAQVFVRGELYTGLANEGPGTVGPFEIDIYLEDNSLYYAFTNSFNYCSDDIHIRGNAVFYVEVDVCVEIDDDFHLNGTNSLMCGEGGASIGLQTAANQVIYEAGADSANLCEGLLIYRGPGGICDPNTGTLVVEGDGPTNLRPRATNDNIQTAQNTSKSVSVLYFGRDDLDLDGATLEILQVGSNAAINDNLTTAGGTLVLNNNGTPLDFTDDFVTYTPPAGYIGGDSFQYIIEDDDGATDTATVSITVACDEGTITTFTYTYATFESEANDVTNETNAEGAPDGAFAQIYTDNETLTLDLGQVYDAGTQYEIVWRRRNNVGSGTAVIDLSESTSPASGYTNHPVSPQNTDNVSFTTTVVTSNVDFRYLRFDKGNTSSVDYEIDAVGVRSGANCETDTDGDGIPNSVDLDDDNDGIPDDEEACPDYTSDVESAVSVDNSNGISGTPDGSYAEIYTNGDVITIDYGRVFPAGTQYILTWQRRPTSGGTAISVISESEDNVSFTNLSSYPQTAVAAVAVDTITSENNFRYLRFTKTNPPSTTDYRIDAVGVLSCKDTDGDGIEDYIDLDSDNDGIADIIEAGGIDANGDGRVDIVEDTDGDGVANLFDSDNGGSALADPDTDGDGLPDRYDIDSDNDGIIDNVEAQSSNGFVALSGNDTDGDGWDDVFDIDLGNDPIQPHDQDGDGVADYLSLDSDGDGLFDWSEGFDDNLSGDALDDMLTRATNFESAAGNPLYYINSDDTDMDGVPDWLEDDDADNLLNFLDPDSPFYQDTDGDGLVDLFDSDNFGTPSTLPDNDGDLLPDFRDGDDQISLPVELLYFITNRIEKHVLLEWATSAEINNDYFTISRSTDGKSFTEIARISGSGNSTTKKEYRLTDLSPNLGINYYKLSQTDFDGTTKVEGIREMDFRLMESSRFVVFPNPSNSESIYFEYVSPIDQVGYVLRIYSSVGKVEYFEQDQSQIIEKEIKFTKFLDRELKAGTYFVELQVGEERMVEKLIVVRD